MSQTRTIWLLFFFLLAIIISLLSDLYLRAHQEKKELHSEFTYWQIPPNAQGKLVDAQSGSLLPSYNFYHQEKKRETFVSSPIKLQSQYYLLTQPTKNYRLLISLKKQLCADIFFCAIYSLKSLPDYQILKLGTWKNPSSAKEIEILLQQKGLRFEFQSKLQKELNFPFEN